jgi:hypothetical protein
MPKKADPAEIERTKPDRVIYDPSHGADRLWDDPEFYWLNEHIHVLETPDKALLATWTAERLNPHDQRVAFSRSEDGGRSWSRATYIDGTGLGQGQGAAWQVPIVGPTGRLYLFYTYGNTDWYPIGFRWRVSDDEGRSWSGPVDLPFPRSAIDDPNPETRSHWIACSPGLFDLGGCPLIAYTHWASNPAVPAGKSSIKELYSHVELMRLDNLADAPDPQDIEITWLTTEQPVTVPHATIAGASFAQEPYMVRLPDERLFMVVRTNRGEIWYSLSENDGISWRPPEVLRYYDGGPRIEQPASPCPVFALQRGDFMLLYNNNNGFVFGADHVWHVNNRRPAYLARGAFRAHAHQPIWWSRPKLFVDNAGVPWGPEGLGRLEAAAYCSLTEVGTDRVLWYPDRKGFLVGKLITDKWLADMDVPE